MVVMYKKHTLKNGLRIITSSMPHMESVSIGVWIGAGSRWENKENAGICHLAEHMLFKGTTSRTATELKEAIEGIGGNFNGFTSEEATCYLVKVPSAYALLGLDILSDMVLNPKLDASEIEKEKDVICEEIKMYEDQPAHLVFDILSEHMWPGHALGRPITGYIDTVKSFERVSLADFMSRFYQPSNVCVVICGRIKEKGIIKSVDGIFSKSPAKKLLSYAPVRKIHKGTAITPFKKETNQTRIAFGFHSIHRTHKLKYAFNLLDVILGANMSSRLFERLRDQKALCYDIASSIKKYKETGGFFIWAGIDHNRLPEATKEVIRELEAVKKEPVGKDELHRAKEYSKGQLLLGLEDTASRMIWLGDRIMTLGKASSIKEIIKGIEMVTAEDVKRLANMIFRKESLNFALVGPTGEDVKEKLAKILEFQ